MKCGQPGFTNDATRIRELTLVRVVVSDVVVVVVLGVEHDEDAAAAFRKARDAVEQSRDPPPRGRHVARGGSGHFRLVRGQHPGSSVSTRWALSPSLSRRCSSQARRPRSIALRRGSGAATDSLQRASSFQSRIGNPWPSIRCRPPETRAPPSSSRDSGAGSRFEGGSALRVPWTTFQHCDRRRSPARARRRWSATHEPARAARNAKSGAWQRQRGMRQRRGRGRVTWFRSKNTAGLAFSRDPDRVCRMDQTIRFVTATDGVKLAYAVSGNGPPLLKTANWLNHLEFDWQSPVWKHWFEPAIHPSHVLSLRHPRQRTVRLVGQQALDFDHQIGRSRTHRRCRGTGQVRACLAFRRALRSPSNTPYAIPNA